MYKKIGQVLPHVAILALASVLVCVGLVSAGFFNTSFFHDKGNQVIEHIVRNHWSAFDEQSVSSSVLPITAQVQANEPTYFSMPFPAQDNIKKVGMHILNVHELDLASQVINDLYGVVDAGSTDGSSAGSTDHSSAGSTLASNKHTETWQYITVPFTLADLDSLNEWQHFFDKARKKRVIPLVRLSTEFKEEAWQQPTRLQIVEQISALSRLTWPTDKKHIIIFNEVNHAQEWGGVIDPIGYADYLHFASHWAKAEDESFVILPAAMDLAAPNGSRTTEAFTYLSSMLEHDPEVFSAIDIWNSHSYPNPAFSAPPTNGGQNSLRGFEKELEFIEQKTGKTYPVIITETGWDLNNARQPQLAQYYLYALQHIWSDSRVLGVTPFILKGDPGPFEGFGYVDASNNPTQQYRALQWALKELNK
jgi:hypothetical protein